MPMLRRGRWLYEDGEDRTVIAKGMSNVLLSMLFRGKSQRACGHRSLEPLVEATGVRLQAEATRLKTGQRLGKGDKVAVRQVKRSKVRVKVTMLSK